MSARDTFVAIADPTRREILDMLCQRQVASAGAIAAEFPKVSRPAISRHLRVLKECGVVVSFQLGKTRNYALNPDPIIELRDGWLKKFSGQSVQSLVRLRQIVESKAE